jgi:20S proteasome subunit beta 4
MTVDEALALMQRCLDELQLRFLLNIKSFKMKIVDKDGVREVMMPVKAAAAAAESV